MKRAVVAGRGENPDASDVYRAVGIIEDALIFLSFNLFPSYLSGPGLTRSFTVIPWLCSSCCKRGDIWPDIATSTC